MKLDRHARPRGRGPPLSVGDPARRLGGGAVRRRDHLRPRPAVRASGRRSALAATVATAGGSPCRIYPGEAPRLSIPISSGWRAISRPPISADATREMLRSAQLSPYEARGQVFVIAEAASLSSEASDALLKAIEEPGLRSPRNFFLLAPSRLDLSPTLRSRSLALYLGAPLAMPEAAARSGRRPVSAAASSASRPVAAHSGCSTPPRGSIRWESGRRRRSKRAASAAATGRGAGGCDGFEDPARPTPLAVRRRGGPDGRARSAEGPLPDPALRRRMLALAEELLDGRRRCACAAFRPIASSKAWSPVTSPVEMVNCPLQRESPFAGSFSRDSLAGSEARTSKGGACGIGGGERRVSVASRAMSAVSFFSLSGLFVCGAAIAAPSSPLLQLLAPPVASFEEEVAERVNAERAACSRAGCPLPPLKLVGVLVGSGRGGTAVRWRATTSSRTATSRPASIRSSA